MIRNTGIIYSSSERTPVVLPELAELFPPLTDEQLSLLEEDIRANGCYSPIIVNEELSIVDGHNRRAVCEKLGVPYQMAVFHFEDTLDAMRWALDTQKSRRNLDTWELGKIALKLKPEVEAKARANMSAGGGDQKSEEARRKNESSTENAESAKSGGATLPYPISPVKTREALGEAVGIGARTMGKVIQIDEHAPQVVKDALDKKQISVNQGYRITRHVQSLPEEQREEAASMAVEVEKMKKELRQSDEETDRRSKIAGQFCKAFEKSLLLRPTEENIGYWVEFCLLQTREIKHAIDEARQLSKMYASIEASLRATYPEAAAALDEEDRRLREETGNASVPEDAADE